jgi:hypothetical protein
LPGQNVSIADASRKLKIQPRQEAARDVVFPYGRKRLYRFERRDKSRLLRVRGAYQRELRLREKTGLQLLHLRAAMRRAHTMHSMTASMLFSPHAMKLQPTNRAPSSFVRRSSQNSMRTFLLAYRARRAFASAYRAGAHINAQSRIRAFYYMLLYTVRVYSRRRGRRFYKVYKRYLRRIHRKTRRQVRKLFRSKSTTKLIRATLRGVMLKNICRAF